MPDKRETVLPDYPWLLFAMAVLVLLYLLGPILAPFLTAAIIAYICSPLVDRLSRLRFGSYSPGRTPCTLMVMLLLAGIVLALFFIVVPLLQKELLTIAGRLPQYFNAARAQLEPWLLQHFGVTLAIDATQIQDIITNNWKSASNFASKFLLVLRNHGFALFGWLVNLLLIPVVLFYVLRDWHAMVEKIAILLPRRWYGKTAEIAREVDQVLAEFLRGQLSVMLIMSAFYSTGLWLAGLELALPIGLIAGLLGFVPYLGIGTGILLATLAGALQFGSLAQMLPLAVVFGLGQILEGFLLTPTLVGDRIGLHPVVVIFALLAGGQLFGFVGVLLALPVSAAIAVTLRHAKRSYLASDTYLQ